jgi:hypothetical protein
MACKTLSVNLLFFKAAIALSNTGVLLLHRHCFHDAAATFRDAVCFIRAAGGERLPRNGGDIQSALRRASRCLTRSLPVDERKRSSAFKVKVLSDHQTRPAEVLHAIHETEFIAVLIDDCRYEDFVHSMHYEALTIMYNYGMTCRCLQCACQKPIQTDLQEAYNSLYKAYRYAIYSSKFMSALQHADEIEMSRMLILAMLVLRSLMKISDQLEMTVQYSNFRVKYDSISETFSRVKNATRWDYRQMAPAA